MGAAGRTRAAGSNIRGVGVVNKDSLGALEALSKTPAACHRRTLKRLAPTICGYCVSILTFQMYKPKEKHLQAEFTAEISAAFVETKAQKRATADNNSLRHM